MKPPADSVGRLLYVADVLMGEGLHAQALEVLEHLELRPLTAQERRAVAATARGLAASCRSTATASQARRPLPANVVPFHRRAALATGPQPA